MSFKDGMGQIVKISATALAFVSLAIWLGSIMPIFDRLGRIAMRAGRPVGPAKFSNRFIAFGVSNDRFNVQQLSRVGVMVRHSCGFLVYFPGKN